jgi:hypothetical protein
VAEERPPARRQLHGYVSAEARSGWYEFAESQNTNVTALLEAVGLRLAQHSGSGRLPPWLNQIVKDAQVVASARSGRRQT